MAEIDDGDAIPTTFTPLKRYTLPERLDGTNKHVTKTTGLYTPLFAGTDADMTSEGL